MEIEIRRILFDGRNQVNCHTEQLTVSPSSPFGALMHLADFAPWLKPGAIHQRPFGTVNNGNTIGAEDPSAVES